MGKNKVVHLSSAHTPFDVRIFLKECRMLAEKGYNVTFIVPHDKNERIDGVYIRSVPKVSGRIKRMTRSVWSVFLTALKEKGDLYHFHDPELIPAGLLLKLFRKRVIYDVHEDLPRQILSKHWILPLLRQTLATLAEWTEGIAAMLFDGIIVVTPEISRRFPEKKTILVQNYPLMNELFPYRERMKDQSEKTVVYVGSISYIRGVKEMIEAIALLPESLGLRLVLAGTFSPPSLLEELQQIKGWNRVQYVGWQSREQIRELLFQAHAGLVTFHPVPNHINAQPNKFFEYMLAGLPIIASDFPKWREILSKNQCGVLVDPLNPKDIANNIHYLIKNPDIVETMGRNGWEAVQKNYTWATEGKKMLGLYQALLGSVTERKKENVLFTSDEE